MDSSFFVIAAIGLAPLVRNELDDLGIPSLRERKGGVSFIATLEHGYRICLWSRIANRVLLKLDSFACVGAENLYDGIRTTDWSRHFGPNSSFAVNFTGTSPGIRNSHFAALKVKDAIVDQFRDTCGQRPDVSTEQPDLRIHVHLSNDVAELYLDLSGDSLHKRAYRKVGGDAPLKENLAAAILIRAGWPEICARGGAFTDPMCGSGTLLIEAAMIAGDIAPGLKRSYFGFFGWKGHDAKIWARLVEDATRRKQECASKIPQITGYDINGRALQSASENIRNAGLEDFIRTECRSIDAIPAPQNDQPPGLIAVNPPYGERVGVERGLEALYTDFGKVLKSRFRAWQVAMLIGDAELGFRIGIRSRRPYTLYNGPIECKLLVFKVDPDCFFQPKDAHSKNNHCGSDSWLDRAGNLATSREPGAGMFANRLRKNLRNLGRWADREQISCYRLYDADMPEYALAIDLYRASSHWVHVQEYQAPRSIDPEKAKARLADALSVIAQVLDVEPQSIFFKVRRQQKGDSQYTRADVPGKFHEIEESGSRFLVNFETYLDTGLFLDHRITRGYIKEFARGRRFLNLFGYTGTATVCAATGGAISTITVDLSRTYLDWARRNLALNGFDSTAHRLIQADVVVWINRAIEKGGPSNEFDLIFLDPPTFSNSKSMQGIFDVQRDHVELLKRSCQLLTPDGLLIFSTNYRKFRLEKDRLAALKLVEISRRTLPRDFERNPGIHRCWEIRRN